MRTLFILLVFFSLAFAMKAINAEKSLKEKSKENVQLIFSKMYKNGFNTL